MKTEFAVTSGFDMSKMSQEVVEMLAKIPFLEAEDIVDAVLYTLSTPPHVQVHELRIIPVNEAF